MDPLTREFVADLESYWRPRQQVADVTRYCRQYLSEPSMSQEDQTFGDFAQAGNHSRRGIVREFLGFIKYYKKWWLLPVLFISVLLVVAGGTAAAPFIYTMF